MADLTSRLGHILGPLLGLLLTIYFGYHLLQGERGIFSWMRLRQKITESEQRLSQVQVEKATLERQVYLLHPSSLDRDMLEQRAREVLNWGYPDEIVIHE